MDVIEVFVVPNQSEVSLPQWTDHWDWNKWKVSLNKATISSSHFLNGSIKMFRVSTGKLRGGFSDKMWFPNKTFNIILNNISIFSNVYIHLLPVCLNMPVSNGRKVGYSQHTLNGNQPVNLPFNPLQPCSSLFNQHSGQQPIPLLMQKTGWF